MVTAAISKVKLFNGLIWCSITAKVLEISYNYVAILSQSKSRTVQYAPLRNAQFHLRKYSWSIQLVWLDGLHYISSLCTSSDWIQSGSNFSLSLILAFCIKEAFLTQKLIPWKLKLRKFWNCGSLQCMEESEFCYCLFC